MSRAASELKLSLSTPSRGVQQWRAEPRRRTRIAWTSSGGRGLPRAVIILPVKFVEARTRWAPPPLMMEELEHNPHEFWCKHGLRHKIPSDSVEVGMDDPKDPAAPRAVSVPDDCGAQWGADHVVVLLIYNEAAGIGEGDGPSVTGQLDDEATYRKEIELMNDFLNGRYVPRLVTRGLVRLPSLTPPTSAAGVVFALASCQYPAGMTDGAPNDHGKPEAPSSASLLRLSRLLTPATSESPSLLVLAGDQVYIDATAGLFDARSQSDRLRLPYQNLFYSPGTQSVFGLLPVAMMLDDHEIVDNWEPGIELRNGDTVFERVEAYRRFQRMAGPPLRPTRALWCEFRHSGVPFFLTDTRTERNTPDHSPRRVDNWREAQIMDSSQWKALRAFLLTHKDEASFVVSPSMFLPRGLGLRRDPGLALESDNWDGFPASRHALLALLCDHDLKRVVFLSGDAHTSCVAQATVTRDDEHCAALWSVHSSGLYCPYPFANGSADSYASDEVFHFRHTDEHGRRHRYRCAVKTECWKPGDGFATLALTDSNRGRQDLRVRFHRAGENAPEPPLQILIDGS